MADVLPFRKPEKLARLPRPDAAGRETLLTGLLKSAAEIEAHPGIVGFSLVALKDDGSRISDSYYTRGAGLQLARQVRREAALIVKTLRTEED